MAPVLSASNLVDTDVVNPDGEDLGKVEELMLDVSDGSVAYAVLSFGGFLGLGDKLFLIPWSHLTLEQEQHRFVLDLPREALEEAPGFDRDHWPNMADASWRSEVDRHYSRVGDSGP
jgi:sporulation protein YlmC with PRC-barrel domain